MNNVYIIPLFLLLQIETFRKTKKTKKNQITNFNTKLNNIYVYLPPILFIMTTIINRLFNLPENVLTEIYSMDSTFRDKLLKEIQYEIFKITWMRFIHKFTNLHAFDNAHSKRRQFAFMFEYILKGESWCISLPCDNIIITSFWKRLEYKNFNLICNYEDEYDEKEDEEGLYINIQFNNTPDSIGYRRRFECLIYTYQQYDNKDPDDWFRTRNYCEVDVYENHEFKLVQILR